MCSIYKQQFQYYRAITVLFIVLYFLTRCVVLTSNYISIDEEKQIYFILWDMALPVIILLSGYMCIDTYWKAEFTKEEKGANKNVCKQAKRSIAAMISIGGILFYFSLGIVSYICRYKEFVSKLIECIVSLAIVDVCWLCFWGDSIKRCKAIVGNPEKKQSIVRICIGGGLIVVTLIVFLYAIDKGETAFFQKLLEEYSK